MGIGPPVTRLILAGGIVLTGAMSYSCLPLECFRRLLHSRSRIFSSDLGVCGYHSSLNSFDNISPAEGSSKAYPHFTPLMVTVDQGP